MLALSLPSLGRPIIRGSISSQNKARVRQSGRCHQKNKRLNVLNSSAHLSQTDDGKKTKMFLHNISNANVSYTASKMPHVKAVDLVSTCLSHLLHF